MLLLLLLADACNCKSGAHIRSLCDISWDHGKALHWWILCPFGCLKLSGRLVGNTLVANDSAALFPPDHHLFSTISVPCFLTGQWCRAYVVSSVLHIHACIFKLPSLRSRSGNKRSPIRFLLRDFTGLARDLCNPGCQPVTTKNCMLHHGKMAWVQSVASW